MKRFICLIVLTALLLTSCGSSVNDLMKSNGIEAGLKISAADTDTDIGSLESFSDEFWMLKAFEEDGKNTLISPLSAYIALAMCANGAKGDTLAAFSALGYSEDKIDEVNSDTAALIGRLIDTSGNTKLNIANSIWLDQSFIPNTDYLSKLAGSFDAEAFTADLPSSVKKVNSWIEDKTNGLIKDMIDDLSGAIAVLINTLYMKAEWSHTFDANDTYKRDFTNADGSISSIDFMNNGTRNEYTIDNDDFEGVMLPYNDDKLAFVALMPKNGLDTSAAVKRLTGNYTMSELLASAKCENTRLALPKFELESSQRLNNLLCDMGLEIAFDSERANFTGMGTTNGGNLYISKVLQNVVLKVDEKGTEVAAATVVVMETTAMPSEDPRVLVFDKPFIFAVVERESGAILFCGSYVNAD